MQGPTSTSWIWYISRRLLHASTPELMLIHPYLSKSEHHSHPCIGALDGSDARLRRRYELPRHSEAIAGPHGHQLPECGAATLIITTANLVFACPHPAFLLRCITQGSRTALHCACESEMEDLAKALLDRDINMNLQDAVHYHPSPLLSNCLCS
jgi:hypothetical protein